MGLLKKRKEKKLAKYKSLLRENRFNSGEISDLTNIYRKIITLSNIFISNIVMFVVALIAIIFALNSDSKVIVESKEIIISVFGSVSGLLIFVSWILTLIVFIKVLICQIKEVKKKALIWAILSILPLISFVALFIMKWKIGHIYRYRN